MDVQTDEKNLPTVLQIMTTEFYGLQSARSIAVSEAMGRSSLYLSTVSTSLVALAFVGQIARLGTAFFLFAFVLFPSLFFLGLVTFQRAAPISLAFFFGLTLEVCVAIGIIGCVLFLLAFYRYLRTRWERAQRSLVSRFPSDLPSQQ